MLEVGGGTGAPPSGGVGSSPIANYGALLLLSSNIFALIQISYLIINIGSPEACNSSIMGIGREDGGFRAPDLVNVLNNDKRLADGLTSMDEDRYFLVNRVGLEKKLALTPKRLFKKLIVNRFDIQGNPRPHHKYARPCTQKLDIITDDLRHESESL